MEEEPDMNVNLKKGVLNPDHPLLEKFQLALKEHLLLQINRMKEEIFEIESETKIKDAQREQLGVQTYEAQQMVCNQQKSLETIISNLETVTAAKEQVQNELELERKNHKDLVEKYHQSEKTNRELQNEIESVNLIIQQMTQWETKIESHISVNKRIAEKTRRDNMLAARENKQQDMLIYKLLVEIWKLESEIETINTQIRVKENEIEHLEQNVALGNTNVEALQSEYRCLMHSWNSVVVAIGNRDKGLECINEELTKLRERFKSTVSETDQVRKLIKKELMENERYTMIKSRFEMDIKNCTLQTEEEMKKKAVIDKEMLELQAILEGTDKEIEVIQNENQLRENALISLTKEFDRISAKKFELEEALLRNLEMQVVNNKISKNLAKIYSTMQVKKRDVEVIMTEAENKSSLIKSETESQKYKNDDNNRLLKEVLDQQAVLEKEADELQSEKDTYELLFRKREREVEVLNSKLEKVSTKPDISTSPQDFQILELEKYIEETQTSIKNLQMYWLREQNNILAVSNERQKQIHEINLLKKQTLILEQKNLKINDELEAYKKNEEKVSHNISNLQNKGVSLCENLFKKRNKKIDLDRNNSLLQTHYDSKLKEAELHLLQIEAEIAEIEEDKVTLSRELMDANREALEWDKKLLMAREALGLMKNERSAGGEVDNMKLEIHRMEVIYGQLKKAQEKLLKDLEYCLSRRNSIYMTSEARQKRNGPKEDRTRFNYQRKMDNLRNKMKQMDNEIKELKVKKRKSIDSAEAKEREIYECNQEANTLLEYSDDLLDQLETTKSNRQFNFELLVMQQKKHSMYHYLSMGRNTYTVYKTAEQLTSEYSKQKDMNGRLAKLVENLRSDFPNYDHPLNRINNTLKIAALTMYT
ncbi:unnamed protein product [Phaedon cochleariae]|uniref:Coiled-coil domain-containing protein 40 n=1 Tax=Phaedon cochleariae TaxID=80249 RepID=A0A9P0GST2_PHACE|nr:unnamed protein product [Phaedon cochleariae]